MSRMIVTSNPAVCSERIAASRPEPGPLTNTSTFRKPRSYASFAAASADTCAANGVFLREPLNPFFPAEDHEIVFPYVSVIVTITLLNVALTNALPFTSTWIFFFFFAAVVGAACCLATICSFQLILSLVIGNLLLIITSRSLTNHQQKITGYQLNYFLAIAFFFPATVFRFPLRVREFVRVRCPRAGSPLR